MAVGALKSWWGERARKLTLWREDRVERLSEWRLDGELKEQARAGARVYAREVWERRAWSLSRPRLASGREIKLAERLREALVEAMAQNAQGAALGREAPLEQLWSWSGLGERLARDLAQGGELKEAALRAEPLMSLSEGWSKQARELLLDEGGYYFEQFREDAALCRAMTETRLRALPLARELLAESRIRVGAPSAKELGAKERGAFEALAVTMAESVVRRRHQLPDPLQSVQSWSELARFLKGEAGVSGPLRSAGALAKELISAYSEPSWCSIVKGYYLDGAGYGWEGFIADARRCEALCGQPILGQAAAVASPAA